MLYRYTYLYWQNYTAEGIVYGTVIIFLSIIMTNGSELELRRFVLLQVKYVFGVLCLLLKACEQLVQKLGTFATVYHIQIKDLRFAAVELLP